MILFKIVVLQLFWLMIVLYGKGIAPFIQITAGATLLFLDYIFFSPAPSKGRYLFLLGLLVTFGYLNDSSLIWLNLIYKDSYQYGNLSLWIIFLAYYEQIFAKLRSVSPLLTSMIGGTAGAFTYWSAAKLGAIMIIPEMEEKFLLMQFFFWAAFFPLSLKLYFSSGYWDRFLDKTIFFSFDKSGFERHQRGFTEDLLQKDIRPKNILVTGATAGIGREAAAFLAGLGGKVIITGRSQSKGSHFEEQYPNSKFVSLDMAAWKEVNEFAKNCVELDFVVFNAGSMPENLSVNEYGVEFQCASQLSGHYYLLEQLRKHNKLRPGARIVWVSSGGMYLKKLDLKNLFINSRYEKVDTYANVKRAQVTLVEELAKKSEWDNFHIYCMHPGWVGTDGLRDALPGFYRFMKNRLRSPAEGADTILWCLLAEAAPESGGFYFDRKKVSPYIGQSYCPTLSQRNELLTNLEKGAI